jgi:DNA-binding transcriptional ArsR family regulator
MGKKSGHGSDTLILDRRQTTTLVSPPRLEIVEAFGALGQASARELAAHLGRPSGAIYHHVRVLEQAGLIREVTRRRGSRRPEAVYATTAPRLAVAAGPSPDANRQAARTLRAVLRQAARDVDAGLARGAPALLGRFHGVQLSAALKPGQVKRVLGLLGEIESVLRRANRVRRHGGDVYRWTSVFVPITRERS